MLDYLHGMKLRQYPEQRKWEIMNNYSFLANESLRRCASTSNASIIGGNGSRCATTNPVAQTTVGSTRGNTLTPAGMPIKSSTLLGKMADHAPEQTCASMLMIELDSSVGIALQFNAAKTVYI